MGSTPITRAGGGLVHRIQAQLQRAGRHPGGSWSLAWIALFAGGVWLDPAEGWVPELAASIGSALFAGLTWVGALAFAGRHAPLWILPTAVAVGLVRAVVASTEGPVVGHLVVLPYESGALLAAAFVVWKAELLEDERGLRCLLVASLVAVAAVEVADAIPAVVAAVPDIRMAWYGVASCTAFLEAGAMWAWIARRELRIEQAEEGRRELEDAVARERRTNDLLRRKEAWLFDFFEKAPDMLLVLAPGTSEILRCNRRFSETIGFARRDLVGRSLLDFVDSGRVAAIRPILHAGRRHVRNLLLHLRRQDGRKLVVLANLVMRSNPDGTTEMRAVLHDVTRLDAVGQVDLRRALVEQAAAGLFHADHRGRCDLVNASFCELTRLTAEAARAHSWLRCVHPDDRQAVEQVWDRCVATGTVFRAEHRLQPLAGSACRVVTECVPLGEAEGGGFSGSMMRVSDPSLPASLGALRRARDGARGDHSTA